MAANKTAPTKKNVDEFLTTVKPTQKHTDSLEILKMMKEITGEKPVLWGNSIIGFGQYHYKYKSGREGDWFMVGFSPRKQNLTLYLMIDFENELKQVLKELGKHKTGKACLYINTLKDIDRNILHHLISESYRIVKKMYPSGVIKN